MTQAPTTPPCAALVNAEKKGGTSTRLDFIQAVSGVLLILFLWAHLLLVSSVVISPKLMNAIGWFFEATYMAQIGGQIIVADDAWGQIAARSCDPGVRHIDSGKRRTRPSGPGRRPRGLAAGRAGRRGAVRCRCCSGDHDHRVAGAFAADSVVRAAGCTLAGPGAIPARWRG